MVGCKSNQFVWKIEEAYPYQQPVPQFFFPKGDTKRFVVLTELEVIKLNDAVYIRLRADEDGLVFEEEMGEYDEEGKEAYRQLLRALGYRNNGPSWNWIIDFYLAGVQQ